MSRLPSSGVALPFDDEGFWRSGRLSLDEEGRRPAIRRWLASGLTVAACLALSASQPAALPGLRPAQSPAAEQVVVAPRAPAPVGPAAAQHALESIAHAFGEPVGLAIQDVTEGWAVAVNGDEAFPQQSVSKTWVALSVLDAVDQGRMTLDQPVLMSAADRSVFNEPLGRSIDEKKPELEVTVAALLRHALIQSDNSANDTLIRLVGLDSVRQTLTDKGLSGIEMGADERNLQSIIAGLTWDPAYGVGRNFEQARAKLPVAAREQARDAYLADPLDGATPLAVVQALSALAQGELLSPESSAEMLGILSRVRTGPMRLKGGLPASWTIAHKTGTGQDFQGASLGINDIGLLTAPDGHQYAVAAFIRHTRQPNGRRLAMMQAVTKAVAAHWAGKPFTVPDLDPPARPKAKAKPKKGRVVASKASKPAA